MLLINKKSLPSDAGLYLEVSLLFPFFLCHHCSQGEEITQCRNKNKSQKIKSRNTKSRNHQNEALDSQVRRMHKHKLGGPQLSGQKQFSLVFVYFYSQFYSLPKNFWFWLLMFSITLTIQDNIMTETKRSIYKHDIYLVFSLLHS